VPGKGGRKVPPCWRTGKKGTARPWDITDRKGRVFKKKGEEKEGLPRPLLEGKEGPP